MKLLKTIPGLEKFCNAIWGGGTTEVVHVQDVGTKLFGKIYIDKISKKAYRCIANPSTTSTDLTASNFEACNVVDNLDKLQNLSRVSIKRIYGVANNTDIGWAFGILRMKDVTTGFYWSSHILVNQVENHLLRNNVHTKNIDALNIRIYNGDLGLESNIYHTVDYCDYFYIS